jgi:site-specific recombinase XerD
MLARTPKRRKDRDSSPSQQSPSSRHPIAIHLLESGFDLRYVQELLGHKSSKTPEIYTYVSKASLANIKNTG